MYTLILAIIIITFQLMSILTLVLNGYHLQIADFRRRLSRASRQNIILRRINADQQLDQRRGNKIIV